jgi:2,3-bisphosphoglycerate-dependent phosphoglycerate mutase
MAGYRECLALLDEVMPQVAQQIGQANLQQTEVGHVPRRPARAMRLSLVRHCQSTGALPESALTKAGHSAATQLTDQLVPLGPDVICASPYARAVSTVAPLAARLMIKINTDDRLRERLRSSEQIEDVDGYLHRSFADEHYRAVGGESLRQAADRGLAALADIRSAGHRCAVVASHRTLITSILRSINRRFGFAEWREMMTPDVFSLWFDEHRPIPFERL